MRNATKFLISMVVFAFLLVGFASATAEVTYKFYDEAGNKVNNVDVLVYVCKNADCSQVTGLPVVDENTADKGEGNDIMIPYPTVLQSYGYGLYFLKDDFIPSEFKATWAGNGTKIQSKTLTKGKNCHAIISDFSVVNTADINVPILVDVAAAAESNAYSPFKPLSSPLAYRPNVSADLYSTTARITMNVLDTNNNDVLSTPMVKTVKIPFGKSENVQFTWTPTEAGNFKVNISSVIADDQCASSYSDYAMKELQILNEEDLKSMCYTLLNKLSVSAQYPVVNTEVTATVEKVSNYADAKGTLNLIDAEVSFIVRNETDAIVYQKDFTSPASEKKITQKWKPTATGKYTIEFTAKGKDSRCTADKNEPETIMHTITVRSEASTLSAANFEVFDAEVPPYNIPGVKIEMTGAGKTKTKTTGNNGKASIKSLSQGKYTYTLTSAYYITHTDEVTIKETDKQITVSLIPKKFKLTVKVVDQSNKPVEGATVAVSLTGTTLSYSRVTGSNGKIVLAKTHAGMLGATAEKGSIKTASTPVDLFKDTEITIVLVQPVENTLPYFVGLSDKEAYIENELEFKVVAEDADNDFIYYAVANMPSGATFENQVFRWKPSKSQLGEHKVTFRVSDDPEFKKETSQTITITVSEPKDMSPKELLDVQKLDVVNEDVLAGGIFTTYMTIANDEVVDHEDVRITVSIPDLGVWTTVGPFDLESGEERTETVSVQIPSNAKPGKYYVRYDLKGARAKVQLTRDFIRIVK